VGEPQSHSKEEEEKRSILTSSQPYFAYIQDSLDKCANLRADNLEA
jgi:hypothetical protein